MAHTPDRARQLERIPVLYSPRQVAKTTSFSRSPEKPGLVVEDWLEAQFPIELIAPEPVSRSTLKLAHDPAFVDGILDLKRRNGFGETSERVAASLPYTVGSMLSAARTALANGRVAVSPSSGFHHAGFATACAFCTFNGLMVTTMALLAEQLIERVAILDCDYHYGDGTDELIERLGVEGQVCNITAGRGYELRAKPFLEALPTIMERLSGVDLILYQAGADPHVDDPLGGFLTTDEMRRRDRIVFAAAHRLGIPIAWNLAGGYQDPLSLVVELHRNTMEACVGEYLGHWDQPGVCEGAVEVSGLA